MFKKKFATLNEIVEGAREIIKKGVENVMVTLGGNGAVLITKNEVYRATFPKVQIKNNCRVRRFNNWRICLWNC